MSCEESQHSTSKQTLKKAILTLIDVNVDVQAVDVVACQGNILADNLVVKLWPGYWWSSSVLVIISVLARPGLSLHQQWISDGGNCKDQVGTCQMSDVDQGVGVLLMCLRTC